MVEIKLVPVHLAKDVWNELHTPLKSAMRYHPGMDVNDLLVLLEQNLCGMFVAIVDSDLIGCFIVNIEEFPRKRICNIVAVAGKNGTTRGWIDEMMIEVEQWAINRNCDLMAGIGRKGWMVAKNHGWKAEHRAILYRELKDNERWRRINDTNPRTMERRTAEPEERLSGS
jgi:hypothetical protein